MEEKPLFDRIKRWYQGLPDKKRYVELVTAILTVPVLATVLYANLQSINKKPEPTPTPPPVIQVLPPVTSASTPIPTENPECQKKVGPVEIESPKEGDVITVDPVAVDISRQSDEYCAIVWSYRINGGSWSDYTDKSIFLYGLSPGEKTLDIRIKSVISGDQVTLSRTFTVEGETTPTPQSSDSASI